ncbi:MAG: blue (type 1) copper domain protein, partial [Chloroflexi bacterium]|nr:blue (type 1) copper domain protein [Chloroflexota bacterium]
MREAKLRRILAAALVGAIGLVTGLTLVALSPVLAQDEMATVSMGDNFFEPFELTVAPGTTITWVNDGADLHDVVSDWFIFDSGLMSPGDSFSWVFSDVGDYAYVCDLHDGMNGVVHVAVAAPPAEPQTAAAPT